MYFFLINREQNYCGFYLQLCCLQDGLMALTLNITTGKKDMKMPVLNVVLFRLQVENGSERTAQKAKAELFARFLKVLGI